MAQHAGVWLGYATVALLCASGLIVSCLSISGAWLVSLAALLAAWLGGDAFPGMRTVIAFFLVAAAVDGIEWMASMWGVRRRGGSRLAGFAAMIGGLAGLFLGTFIPIPLIGNLIGMMIGSFGLAYAVERHRLKVAGHAAHIAFGAVMACVAMLFLKVAVTTGLIAYLVYGLLAG